MARVQPCYKGVTGFKGGAEGACRGPTRGLSGKRVYHEVAKRVTKWLQGLQGVNKGGAGLRSTTGLPGSPLQGFARVVHQNLPGSARISHGSQCETQPSLIQNGLQWDKRPTLELRLFINEPALMRALRASIASRIYFQYPSYLSCLKAPLWLMSPIFSQHKATSLISLQGHAPW